MSEPAASESLYQLLGGAPVLQAVVHRFYDLMESQAEFEALRAMHAPDLGPMREKLSDWMTGWLGGPPLYDERPDATCIGHAHAAYTIDAVMRDAWVQCMYRALDDCAIPQALQTRLRPPVAAMAEFLRNH